jgi:hypothetical protein
MEQCNGLENKICRPKMGLCCYVLWYLRRRNATSACILLYPHRDTDIDALVPNAGQRNILDKTIQNNEDGCVQ